VELRVPRPPAAPPLEAFSAEEIAACLAYAKPRQRWGMVAFAVDALLLVALALTPPGRRVVSWFVGLGGGFVPGRAALAVTVVVLAQAVVSLPFSLRSFRQDQRAGLATQRPRGFMLDWAKSRGIGLVLTVLPIGALILAAHYRVFGYPWTAAAVGALLVVLLALIGPVVLEPLFNRFVPLAAGALRERVLRMATQMRVPVRDVLVSDASRRTTRVNAYVSGVGRTRRVVVYDTLLRPDGERPVSPEREDEVALVLAHELAHVAHRDVLWGTVAGAVLTGAGVLLVNWLLGLGWVERLLHAGGLGDPLVAPGLLLLGAIGGLLASPVASAVSRWAEARADWAALEVSRDPATAVEVERRLALENRADLRPNRLMVLVFASHPPTMARIAQARLWAERNAGHAGVGAP
jgi:Zn-dependent protease with chaperone function